MAERIWSTSSSSYVTEKHKERHAIKRYKARESAGHLAFMSSNRTSFGVYLRTKSARLTPQNIVNVPMETICANIPISNTKVKTPVRAQVKMLAFTGVPYVSKRSRCISASIRLSPSPCILSAVQLNIPTEKSRYKR